DGDALAAEDLDVGVRFVEELRHGPDGSPRLLAGAARRTGNDGVDVEAGAARHRRTHAHRVGLTGRGDEEGGVGRARRRATLRVVDALDDRRRRLTGSKIDDGDRLVVLGETAEIAGRRAA